MLRVCAYCDHQVGVTDDHIEGDTTVTHGVCPGCKRLALLHAELPVRGPEANGLWWLMAIRRRHRKTASPGWVVNVLRSVRELEIGGLSHFGGVEVLCWWLARETQRGRFRDTLEIDSYLARLKDERV